MNRRRSLYARPESFRGEQCAEAPPGRRRSDQVACRVVRQAASRPGRWPHPRAVKLAERRLCPSTTVRRPNRVTVPGCPDAHPGPGRPVQLLGQRPGVQRPPVQRPPVRRPASGVQWPVSARPLSGATSAICPSSVRIRVVRSGRFLERVGCQPDRGPAGSRVTHHVRGRLIGCSSPRWHGQLARAALGSGASAWCSAGA
jgi:hypothetical protein